MLLRVAETTPMTFYDGGRCHTVIVSVDAPGGNVFLDGALNGKNRRGGGGLSFFVDTSCSLGGQE